MTSAFLTVKSAGNANREPVNRPVTLLTNVIASTRGGPREPAVSNGLTGPARRESAPSHTRFVVKTFSDRVTKFPSPVTELSLSIVSDLVPRLRQRRIGNLPGRTPFI